MASKNPDDLGWLSYIILGVWVVNALLIVFLITRIDTIVHGQLYGYGLQFSRNWADPYWETVNLIYIFMALPSVLSVIVIGIMLKKKVKVHRKDFSKLRIRRQKEAVKIKIPEVKPATVIEEPEETPVECAPQEPKPPEPVIEPYEPKMEVINEVEMNENNGLLISCPSCKKVFNRPLVMLDFSSGKTRLVNICPYCSHTLGEAVEQKKDNEDTTVSSAESDS